MLSPRATLPTEGGPLLVVIRKTTKPRQRRAALEALANAVDPPPETLGAIVRFALDPQADEALRVAVLQAATHAVLVHDQRDLEALRGVLLADDSLEELDERLTRFAAQLDIWATTDEDTSSALRLAARHLALVLHRLTPTPIAKLTVVEVQPETLGGAANGVVDGVWDSTDQRTMWLHTASEQATLLLDLGEEQSIVGVRIWNANAADATARGWRSVEVLAGTSQDELTTVAQGVVPPAPRQAPASDYGTTLLLRPMRARYVRLQTNTFYGEEGPAGLAEVQVLR